MHPGVVVVCSYNCMSACGGSQCSDMWAYVGTCTNGFKKPEKPILYHTQFRQSDNNQWNSKEILTLSQGNKAW